MTDPYRVLGVTRDASTDEIKRHIVHSAGNTILMQISIIPIRIRRKRCLSRSSRRIKQIMDEREGKTSSYGGQGYGGFGGLVMDRAAGRIPTEVVKKKWRCVRRQTLSIIGCSGEAMNVLNQIAGRSAQWYYLHAVANYGMGNNINAVQDAMQAVNLEPDNFQYRQLLQQLQGGGQWYTSMGEDYGFDRSNTGFGSFCCQCLAINALCNCCC